MSYKAVAHVKLSRNSHRREAYFCRRMTHKLVVHFNIWMRPFYLQLRSSYLRFVLYLEVGEP